MGKLNYDATIQHFSHYHPLQLLNTHQQLTPNLFAPCSGCKLASSGLIYNCKSCNYNLHISCSQMPLLINHPSDPKHALSLLVSPAYPGGRFNCDACGRQGDGFSYHCTICNLDLHMSCASKPLSVNHQNHSHTLNLAFYPPYQAKGFSCDICHKMGSNHWLYRCSTCEFDAHIGCANAKPSGSATVKPSVPQQNNHLLQHQYQSFPAANHTQSYFKHPETLVGSPLPHHQPNRVQSNPLTAQTIHCYNFTQYQHPGAETGIMYRPRMNQQQQQQQQGHMLMQTATEGLIDCAVELASQTSIQDLTGDAGNGVDHSYLQDAQWSVQDIMDNSGNGVDILSFLDAQW